LPPLVFGPAVCEERFRQIQNRLALDHYKWDTQVGDTSTLFRQPLFITLQTWHELRTMAENLAAELAVAEQEILAHPELDAILGLPQSSQAVLEKARRHGPTPAAVRTLRFDFHYTTEGWLISEVNSDVPGGYTEASCFTEFMAAEFSGTQPTGNPAKQWTEAMVSATQRSGRVALLSAPGFLEDQQVTAFLAGQLQARRMETFLLHHPAQLHWKSGRASIMAGNTLTEIDSIVRFYQAEWLLKLPGNSEWRWLFAEGKTPVANPGIALLTESKRLPLLWNQMAGTMTAWQSLLPECCDPTDSRWQQSDAWVLKQAFSNTGDSVHIREYTDRSEWFKLCQQAKKHPERWVVQRRFESIPINSDTGPVHPCLGVYTINGSAAGIYARVSAKTVIDYAAMDAAVLISTNG
jgi:glutathionylspermidine synthase